jgi:hypothetical protein
MIIFITMRVVAAICPRARPSELKMGTLHQPPAFGASSGSFLASKPGLFLASAEDWESIAKPFQWKFTRQDLARFLARCSTGFSSRRLVA